MSVKKIPMSFNDDDQAKIAELAELMGITGVYGDFSKAVRFGIVVALAALKEPTKVYSTLEGPELEVYFQAVRKFELKRRLLQNAEKLTKEAEKV